MTTSYLLATAAFLAITFIAALVGRAFLSARACWGGGLRGGSLSAAEVSGPLLGVGQAIPPAPSPSAPPSQETVGGASSPDLPLAFSLALGYAALAYAVAALGLLKRLGTPELLALLALFALIGARQARPLIADLRALAARLAAALTSPGGRWPHLACLCAIATIPLLILGGTGVVGNGPLALLAVCIGVLAALAIWRPGFGIAWLLITWAAITFLAALAPPADLDWDGLAEHLAQARTYARLGAYVPLWYDHHSHFPSLTQMLFTLGIKLAGVSLAKLFHWAFGLLALAAAFDLGNIISARAVGGAGSVAAASPPPKHPAPPGPRPSWSQGGGPGKWAALTLAATPLIGYLMQVGYVDLATLAYTLLALLAFARWTQGLGCALLPGLFVGLAMATKAQALPVCGVLFLAVAILALRRLPLAHAARALAAFALAAALVAGPWYAKSWLTTGNPVYPFAYGLFGGKHWSEAEARPYEYHQKEFGKDHLPPADQYWNLPASQRRFIGPRAPINLLLAPWNITFDPVPFTDMWRQGNARLTTVLLMFWIGPLWLIGVVAYLAFALVGAVADRDRRPPSAVASAVPPSSRAASPRGRGGQGGEASWLLLFLPLWLWWLMTMQFSRYLLVYLTPLLPVVAIVWARCERTLARAFPILCLACALGMAATIAMPALSTVGGMISQDQYLRATCQVYEPSMFLSRIVPPDGKVITYGEPRGFYIDRDYLWGDPGHHRLIPYDDVKTPKALLTHLRAMGITHALINQAFTGPITESTPGPLGLLIRALKSGQVRQLTDDPLTRHEYLILDLAPPT